MKCKKCGSSLELCPADWPWTEDHLICPNCDSTYIIEVKSKAGSSEDIPSDP